MTTPHKFQLKLDAPSFSSFPVGLGVQCGEDEITAIHYLEPEEGALPPQNHLAAEMGRRLRAYLESPKNPKAACFGGLPLRGAPAPAEGKRDEREAREAILQIPYGDFSTYSEIAASIDWSENEKDKDDRNGPQSVGDACGNNSLGIVIPCYRVVSKDGPKCRLGTFHLGNPCVTSETALKVKLWLLEHEGVEVVKDEKLPMPKWEVRRKSS